MNISYTSSPDTLHALGKEKVSSFLYLAEMKSYNFGASYSMTFAFYGAKPKNANDPLGGGFKDKGGDIFLCQVCGELTK